jgi:hypothetical protein
MILVLVPRYECDKYLKKGKYKNLYDNLIKLAEMLFGQ